MAYLCEAFDKATNICLQWTEYAHHSRAYKRADWPDMGLVHCSHAHLMGV
jgi:hypothetical protein